MTYRDEKEQVIRHTWNIWPERVLPHVKGEDMFAWTAWLVCLGLLTAGGVGLGSFIYDWRLEQRDAGLPITSCSVTYTYKTYNVIVHRGRHKAVVGNELPNLEETHKLMERVCPKP